jgi:transglutaminase-like putative cysteine protease
MPTYKIKHLTKYSYNSPVIDSANQIMLYPVVDLLQEVNQHELTITKNPAVEVFTDYFGNTVGLFSLVTPHVELSIKSVIEVTTNAASPPSDEIPADEQWNKLEMIQDEFPYMDFLSKEAFISLDELKAEVSRLMRPDKTPFQVAREMADFVCKHFEYKQGITTVETGIEEVWSLKAGVCQDFAHILLVMLRIVGIPARYVSGYICPKNHDMRGEGATHAWVDAYIPGYGWIGLDPTNNCIVTDRHIRLAVGRNFSDCTPVKGTYKGQAEHTLEVSVTIENGAIERVDRADETIPTFTYHVRQPAQPVNSYRKYMEMQQQQ